MKIILALIMCSYTAGICLPPYIYPEKFNDQYDCFMEGYNQSILKMEQIGREEINEHEIYIRFICSQYIPEDTTKQDT
jgi:hypothetical protein|tara:strand:+ start:442 stop:675 length:234 start_codon:yes stop_codon:yes gene_type:complete